MPVLYESDGTQWIEVGGGGGDGFQFNSGTYGADNVGDYTTIETTGTNPNGVGVTFFNANGMRLDGTDGAAGPALDIVQTVAGDSHGFSSLIVDADDGGGNSNFPIATDSEVSLSGTNSSGIAVLGAILAHHTWSASGADVGSGAIGIKAQSIAQSSSSGASTGLVAKATNSGTGTEIAGYFQTGGGQTGANSCAILCEASGFTPIFEVRDDGSIHGLASVGAITWDL